LIWTETRIHETSAGAEVAALERRGLEAPPYPEPVARWVGEVHIAEIVMAPGVEPGSAQQSLKRSILSWEAKTGRRSAVVEAPHACALSVAPDGSQIAEAGADMRVRIRNGVTLALERTLRVHDGPVIDVAWHPKLPLLATVSSDRTVKIWDLRSDSLVEEYGVISPAARTLYWSPDGTVLAVRLSGLAASSEGTNRWGANVHLFSPKACQKD